MNTKIMMLAGAAVLAISTAAAGQTTAPSATPTTNSTQPVTTTTTPTPPTGKTTAPGQTQTAPGTASQSVPGQTQSMPDAASDTAPGQTGTTPGQMQTAPGEASELAPAQTGQTPSGQTTGNAAPELTAATAADVKAGVSVYDQKGKVVGKIESVTSDGAVVSTGKTKASIPISSFAKSDQGLVISMSKAELDAQAKQTTKTTKKPK